MIGLGLAAFCVLVWIVLLVGHGRFWRSGPQLAPAGPADAPAVWPEVSIVVPARDEAASVEACLRSLLAQDYAGKFRVILVDDGSTDGTGAIARAVAATRGGDCLGVIDGTPRRDGWSGKLWAVSQGIEAATGEYLLLADADIVHDPRHLGTLVAKAEQGLDLVSEMVALNCTSLAERALMPAFVFFFQLLYPFAQVNDPRHRIAAAAGGTILLRREMLARIGGIASVRGALIDDVALAQAVKRAGRRIWLGHTTLARSLRACPGFADIWRMVARTAYVQLRFSPLLLVGTVLALALIWLAPPAVALLGHGAARWLGLIAWAMASLSYLPSLRRFGRSPVWAPFLPLVALFYMAATVGSAIDHHRGRGVVWRGRAYDGEAKA